MSHITQEQLDHLQTLSNISLKPSEQTSFLQKLDPIIAKLNELAQINTDQIFHNTSWENTLRDLDWVFDSPKQQQIAKDILKNIDHEVINNSIVIKSVLS